MHRSETSEGMAHMAGSPHLAKKQSCKKADVVRDEEQPTNGTKSFASQIPEFREVQRADRRSEIHDDRGTFGNKLQ